MNTDALCRILKLKQDRIMVNRCKHIIIYVKTRKLLTEAYFVQTTYVKIYKSGNGQAISLKKNTLQEAGLKVSDDIEVKVKSGQIVLTKSDSFKEKWRDFVESGGKYDHNEYDWGQPVGRELW